MNRRKPVKKEYFTFFSTLSSRWLVFSAIFLIVIVASGLLVQAILTNSEMGGEDIVAVLAMVIIPLLILYVTVIVFEKVTGLAIIAGVEWIGRKTLEMIDWGISGMKSSLGFEQKKTNPRTGRQAKQTAVQVPEAVTPGSFLVTEPEPIFAKQTEAESEPIFSAFQTQEAAQSDTDTDFAFSSAEQAEDEQQPADSPISIVLEKQGLVDDAIKQEDTNSEADMALATPSDEPQLQEEPVDLGQAEHEEKDPDATFDEFETELKLFYSENDSVNNEATQEQLHEFSTIEHTETAIDSSFQPIAEERDDEIVDSQAAPNKSDYMIAALQAAKDRKNTPISSEASIEEQSTAASIVSDARTGTDANHLYDAPNTTDIIIKALQEAAKDKVAAENQSTDPAELTEQLIASEDSSAQPSLLDQAEKTAVSLFSAFTEKFSKSFVPQQESSFRLPSVELLEVHQQSIKGYSAEELEEMSRTVERVLKDYKVIAEVAGAYPGPIITRFELSLAPGVKVSRVSGLAKDLARAMLVTSVRVVEIIEGTPYIGLEIPNQERELVSFREIIESDKFQQAVSPITLALGKDVSGQTVVSDLAKMPHLLVAGTTGSGKSVAINTMILSMLYKATPDQVRMIMVDPKMLELSIYEGIPHLLTPVVTDMKEAQNALRWAVAEMERRYKLMSKVGVRNLAGFNQKIEEAEARGEPMRDPLFQLIDPLQEGESFPVLSTLPNIVIVIDELADMMMIVGKKVEELIARLAQKARAAGIHLVLATQRPSVDVLTGLIKANVPTRISFQVSSRIDSRTILDQGGAEALLGNGDMLFLPSGTSIPVRAHGAFVDDHEVHKIVEFLKKTAPANYMEEITQERSDIGEAVSEGGGDSEMDVLYDEAVMFVTESRKASISSVQRRFKVGYNRAARMIEDMEAAGVVSAPEGNGSRQVLAPPAPRD